MPFPISDDEVRKIETALGATLPPTYRESMMQANGGTVEVDGDTWELFPLRDGSDRKRLSRTANHVLHETQKAQEWPNYHENAIAIAGDGSGDLLVLFQEGPEIRPQVFIWSHVDGSLQLTANDFREIRRA